MPPSSHPEWNQQFATSRDVAKSAEALDRDLDLPDAVKARLADEHKGLDHAHLSNERDNVIKALYGSENLAAVTDTSDRNVLDTQKLNDIPSKAVENATTQTANLAYWDQLGKSTKPMIERALHRDKANIDKFSYGVRYEQKVSFKERLIETLRSTSKIPNSIASFFRGVIPEGNAEAKAAVEEVLMKVYKVNDPNELGEAIHREQLMYAANTTPPAALCSFITTLDENAEYLDGIDDQQVEALATERVAANSDTLEGILDASGIGFANTLKFYLNDVSENSTLIEAFPVSHFNAFLKSFNLMNPTAARELITQIAMQVRQDREHLPTGHLQSEDDYKEIADKLADMAVESPIMVPALFGLIHIDRDGMDNGDSLEDINLKKMEFIIAMEAWAYIDNQQVVSLLELSSISLVDLLRNFANSVYSDKTVITPSSNTMGDHYRETFLQKGLRNFGYHKK